MHIYIYQCIMEEEKINILFYSILQIIKKKDYAGPPSAYCPIRARLAGQWEAGLKHISIMWISGGRRGEIVRVNPLSKCASCHSNEMHQRIIHTHVNVSSKAYVFDETIYNSCARARFAGCTYLRNIILALNTVRSVSRLYFSARGVIGLVESQPTILAAIDHPRCVRNPRARSRKRCRS